ncbi:hypothetical protein GCM10022235_85420 [Kribbella ginsengisoli]|uniref:Ig-like domain-containing protein n=1 Tax=Kribbella ginsengisoli TaxID=363865 RepID=A0ABP6Z7R2_9ACTN
MFRVAGKPQCPSSGPAVSFPGEPVVLEWRVIGTDSVTISIDGPGRFASYPAKHRESLPFSCGATASGSVQRHTYLLTATGHGIIRQRSISVTARVN